MATETIHVRAPTILFYADSAIRAFPHILAEEETPKTHHVIVMAESSFMPWPLTSEAGIGSALLTHQSSLVSLAFDSASTLGRRTPYHVWVSVHESRKSVLK